MCNQPPGCLHNTWSSLQTNWRRDIYEVVADDVGMHDLITSMCDSRRYKIDYGVEGHRSCRTNFTEALAPWHYDEWQVPEQG